MTVAIRRLRHLARISAQRSQCCSAPHPRHFTSTTTLSQADPKNANPQELRKLFDENLPRYIRSPKDLEGLPDGWKESLDTVEDDIEASEADYEDLFQKSLSDRDEEPFDITEDEAAGLLDEENLEREPRWPEGFFAIDEERDDPGEDPEFENDDITSLAHGELEQHREIREFARIMAWDMPLLYNHIKPFEPPTSSTTPLRFRYTTYLGEEHPAARKVVLTFNPTTLPNLTPTQSNKLIKLLGVRYNPSTHTAKLSAELYPTPAQNKRYLGDLFTKLTTEARDATDTFEDVPFDFRHHKPKKEHLFPEEWKLTEERRRMLEEKRAKVNKEEFDREYTGKLVQGAKVIEAGLGEKVKMLGEAQKQREGVAVMAGLDQKSKAQKSRLMKRR